MAKKSNSIIFCCSACGYTHPKWLGRCPECGSWNTLEEYIESPAAGSVSGKAGEKPPKIKPVPLENIKTEDRGRIFTGISEFDRVLGGGAAKRSAILIGGEPGIGKSTLLLQAAAKYAESSGAKTLYVSGEESASQIKDRAERLRLRAPTVEILCSTRLEDILSALDRTSPVFTIIDSIQTVNSFEAGAIPGTVNQLKYCANELIGWIKERDGVMIMTAHITKEGSIAGPKSLEHMVDTVISFEGINNEFRFLRAQKNRFGSVDELGILSMTEKGLEAARDPESMFITKRQGEQPAGVATAVVFEGSRVFLVEIQALTVPAKAAITRVYSEKIDSARVSRIAAVLEKRLGIRFSDQDIYINVAGGIRLSESAIDASLAAALYSARTDIAVPANTALCGELSLAGEIRPVNRLRQRIKAAEALGYTKIYAPEKEEGAFAVATVKDMVKALFGK
ncbi:DNA repair protein RadA [Treponema parvum]|uniref:DNA repair protein RadA n=1 Tax=Treponema parvum TaxID=138851 RepID=A0A975F169_9SPIR|nr:DNA repair protein RadA [Treponema parvum]QTQ12546.1 DNA repair protein RadA [Treponema parvum]